MALDSDAAPPLGARIRAHRQRLGLSQSAFAAALDRLAWERAGAPDRWQTLGVDQPMVSDWERGRHRPDAYYQDLLCALLDVTAYDLGFRQRLPWEPAGREHDDEPAGASESVPLHRRSRAPSLTSPASRSATWGAQSGTTRHRSSPERGSPKRCSRGSRMAWGRQHS